MYKAKYQTYGTLMNLGNAGFLMDNALVSGKYYDYNFICIADNVSWSAIATPDNSALPAYRMTQDGVLETINPGETEFKPRNGD